MTNDKWIDETWGTEAPLMRQAIKEIQPNPHFYTDPGKNAEIAYRIMKRFKELKRLAVTQSA